MLKRLLSGMAVAAAFVSVAAAQDLPKSQFKVIGLNSPTPVSIHDELPFWRDALKGHLDARGYALKSERCFSTTRGLPGCTLDFVVPRGAEDWVMSETVFVDGDTVYLVEVAGPFERYAQVETALTQAMTTFAPRP